MSRADPDSVTDSVTLAFSSLQCSIGTRVDGNDTHAFRLAMVFRVRHRQ